MPETPKAPAPGKRADEEQQEQRERVTSDVKLHARQTLRAFSFRPRAPLSRDKRRPTDDSSKKATAAPDPPERGGHLG